MNDPLRISMSAWSSDREATEQPPHCCAVYARRVFRPSAPRLYQPFLERDAVPEEHKSGIDMGRDLPAAHVLVVCGSISTESMKTMWLWPSCWGSRQPADGILTVKRQGCRC